MGDDETTYCFEVSVTVSPASVPGDYEVTIHVSAHVTCADGTQYDEDFEDTMSFGDDIPTPSGGEDGAYEWGEEMAAVWVEDLVAQVAQNCETKQCMQRPAS